MRELGAELLHLSSSTSLHFKARAQYLLNAKFGVDLT